MKEQKLNGLIKAARAEPAPALSPGFEVRLMRVLPQREGAESVPLTDQLAALFPRIALTAALAIGLCVAADLYLGTSGPMDLSEGINQVTEHWLFAVR